MQEKIHPLPSHAVITKIIIKSNEDFAIKIVTSLKIESLIAPIIAIAPIQTVNDAVTNAFTNVLSSLFPDFFFNHSPKFLNFLSMFIISPISPQKIKLIINKISPSVFSIPSSNSKYHLHKNFSNYNKKF